jgi:hypothetical protein
VGHLAVMRLTPRPSRSRRGSAHESLAVHEALEGGRCRDHLG